MTEPISLPDDPRWPRAGGWPEWTGREDAVLLGAPASKTSLSPSGAHATPAAVREALRRFSPTLVGPPPLDLNDVLNIADAGDVDDPDGPDGEQRLRQRVGELHRAGLVIALGGDNSITYATAQGARATGLITIDAHFDLRDGESNGSPVRRLIDDGFDPRRIVQLGIADFANSAEYARRAADYGITVITLDQLSRRGMDDVVAEALEIAGVGHRIHLDIDVDVCDRSVAPGCPASLPGGLAAWELRALVRSLAVDPRVRSADIVEVDATADAPDGRTVRLAALCVLELLTGLAGRPAAAAAAAAAAKAAEEAAAARAAEEEAATDEESDDDGGEEAASVSPEGSA
jgi:Arginase/agmatinase/formimionoglutamate hydrolase, arginase family